MRAISLVALIILGLLPKAGADPRLEGLSLPTLNLSLAVPASYPNVVFPTDENGLGIPLIRARYEIFKFPQNLADRDLFPKKTVVFNYTGANDGSGGLFLPLELLGFPVGVGAYLNRPDQNGWVTGAPRGELAGLGGSFGADIPNNIPAGDYPAAPQNHADVFIAAAFPFGLRV